MSNKEERMNRNKSIIEDYKNGKPILEIAREYNLSETMCYKILKGTQEPPRYFEKKRKKLTTRNEQIVKQYAEHVKYLWLTADDNSDVKVYDQKRLVEYADYKPGMLYVSVYEVFPAGEGH